MHPNRAFAWEDRDELLRFVADRAFAHVFTSSDSGLFVVHAPVLVTAEGNIRFHVARRNRVADHLGERRVLISVSGREAYQSANWYVAENQVPTWHYEAVEIEGTAQTLADEELVDLLDRLSKHFEDIHQPEKPWTRDKMEPGRFDAMTKAIVGFEVSPTGIRGTRKFNQHKSDADLAATIAGQEEAGRADIVAAIREARGYNE
ncbi:FMN-binding negative transcriptional regulator [Sphingomonas daechungensis]|uniref:FMN-binding negative transcriptional regulator n=1 Tax=Sphingomonas daechungensis TaxID=1176646 RepID=A0ABX6T245_9SPHN|nr:FMN-binding negative transcriptional regulator [Sphingomonas daechungensis]QNP43288.1 FMN-binding negative transcriptional regulator [Sphingomonas daechungensis]